MRQEIFKLGLPKFYGLIVVALLAYNCLKLLSSYLAANRLRCLYETF